MPVPQVGHVRTRFDAQNDMLLRIVNKQDKVPIGVDGGQYVAGGEETVPNEISTLVTDRASIRLSSLEGTVVNSGGR
jgi:hypothetical protein